MAGRVVKGLNGWKPQKLRRGVAVVVSQGSNVRSLCSSLARVDADERRAVMTRVSSEVIGSPDRIPDHLQGIAAGYSFHGVFAVDDVGQDD